MTPDIVLLIFGLVLIATALIGRRIERRCAQRHQARMDQFIAETNAFAEMSKAIQGRAGHDLVMAAPMSLSMSCAQASGEHRVQLLNATSRLLGGMSSGYMMPIARDWLNERQAWQKTHQKGRAYKC